MVQAAVEAEHRGSPDRAALVEQDQRPRREDAQLRGWLARTSDSPAAQQEQLAVTAAAMGLSLNQVVVLLALLPGRRAGPGRSTVHRRIKAAGSAAGRVLRSLDARCRASIPVGCLDGIRFHGRPVLVGVEPASMAWFLGRVAPDRTGATRARALHDRTALEFVAADAGTGLQAGIAAGQRRRREPGQTPLESGLDVSHTTQEARRVLRRNWSRVERCWEQAEAATRRAEQARRQGLDARGVAAAARWARKRAEAAFGQYERSEAGWKTAHGAPSVSRPDGRLNDRAWARERIALASPTASGRAWSKVRGLLQAEGTLTSLGRLHRRLREAVPDDRCRAESVRLWWPRRRRPRANDTGHVEGAGHVAHLVHQVVCREVDANWREAYDAVSRLLRRTVRASSAVECLSSALRMHQARPRTVTQGLLDLKRLHWNGHEYREGRRRRPSPNELSGLKLPSYRFRDPLRMPLPMAETI